MITSWHNVQIISLIRRVPTTERRQVEEQVASYTNLSAISTTVEGEEFHRINIKV